MSSLVPDLFKSVMNTVRGIGRLSPNLPFELDELLLHSSDNDSLWSIHIGHALKPEPDIDPRVTLFVADIAQRPKDIVAAVRANVRRLKTLRHPNILRYIADFENENQIILVTERVYPVIQNIDEIMASSETRLWFLHTLLKGTEFLNFSAGIIHGNLRASALFLTPANELRIGGFELSSTVKDLDSLITMYHVIFKGIDFRDWPPEIAVPSRLMTWDQLKTHPVWSIDAFMIARSMVSLFSSSERMPSEISSFTNICLSSDPRSRPDYRSLLHKSKLFTGLKILEYSESLENLNGRDFDTRELFFSDLLANHPTMSKTFLAYKVLPLLRTHIMTNNAHLTTNAIVLFFTSASNLDRQDYGFLVLPVIKLLFSKDDRHIRLALLDSLSVVAANVEDAFIQEAVYQKYASGFTDSSPGIREATLKASIFLAPKLSSRQLNGELLRFYARLQADPEPGIRANTAICLGYVAKYLDASTRSKILGIALVKTLSDPFGPSRKAGLSEIAKCVEYFDPRDLAKSILPLIVPMMIDDDEEIKSKALQLVLDLVEKIRTFATTSAPPRDHHQTVDSKFKLDEPSSRPSLQLQPTRSTSTSDRTLDHCIAPDANKISFSSPRLETTESREKGESVSTLPGASASICSREPQSKLVVRTSRPMVLRKERFSDQKPEDC